MENFTGNKYKLFRNYMSNELGITRDDIMAWTKQSIAEQVTKAIHGFDINVMVESEVRKHLANWTFRSDTITKSVERMLRDKYTLNLEVKE